MTTDEIRGMIYLDHNATTPMPTEVLESISAVHASRFANPASQHAEGRRAKAALDQIREQIRERIGGRDRGHLSDRIIFTSGGTEANNLAIRGLCGDPPGRVIISSIEHPCVSGAARELERLGYEVVRLPCDGNGVICLEALRSEVTVETRLVSLMVANHETGVIQPVEDAASICRDYGVPLHTDASQAVGKISLNFARLGAAAMTVSAHKFHGPRGSGALVVANGISLTPILFGGGQQLETRPGTESIALPAGMNQALAWSEQKRLTEPQRISRMRDRFEEVLIEQLPNVVINGREANRLPNTSSVAFLGLDRQALLMALDYAGVACSTGSACASGSSEPSSVLLGMGCSNEVVEGSLRFSLGHQNTPDQVAEAAEIIVRIVARLR